MHCLRHLFEAGATAAGRSSTQVEPDAILDADLVRSHFLRTVFAVIGRYKLGFDKYDDQKLRSRFSWHGAVLNNGNADMISELPVTTAQMKTLKNWHHSIHWEIDIIAASDTKARVVLCNVERPRADTS